MDVKGGLGATLEQAHGQVLIKFMEDPATDMQGELPRQGQHLNKANGNSRSVSRTELDSISAPVVSDSARSFKILLNVPRHSLHVIRHPFNDFHIPPIQVHVRTADH